MKIENIKFKAKRIDNNTWVEGYFYAECGNTYIIEDRQSELMLNRNEAYQVDPLTVCQFTGLKDCEGKVNKGIVGAVLIILLQIQSAG